jgi:hypothetical protein
MSSREGLGEVLVGVGAGEHVADGVVGTGEALERVAVANEDRSQTVAQRIEVLGADAVASGLLGEPRPRYVAAAMSLYPGGIPVIQTVLSFSRIERR